MSNLTPQLRELLERDHSKAHLLTILLDDANIYLTDAAHDITYGGVTYQSGILQGIPNFEVTGDVKVGDSTFTLNATNSDIAALFFHKQWINRHVVLHRVYFDLDMKTVGAINLWQGLLTNKGGDEESNSATLSLTAASAWADFKASRGRRTNHNSQQIYHPGDNGFIFAGTLQDKIDWGQKSKSGAAAYGGGGSRGSGFEAPQRQH